MVLLLCFYASYASAKIEVTYGNIDIEDFTIGYLHDDTDSLKIEDVINLNFMKATNKSSFKTKHNVTWYKIEVENTTNTPKKIYLHNNFAYMYKSIAIFEFIGKQQVDQNIYNIDDEDIGDKLSGSSLVYPVFLPQNSTKTLYIKNHTQVYQIADFSIYDEHNSDKALIGKNFYSNALVSILFALATFNIVLFLFTKRKEFAYYALYLYNASLGLLFMYGTLFHDLGFYSPKINWFNITALLVSPLLILFVKSIFNTAQTDKKIDKILNSVIFLSVIYLIVALFISLDFSMQAIGFLFLYTFIVLIYIGTHFYIKKHPLAKVFLSAYLAYIFGMGFTLSFLMGYTPYNFFIFHASGIGLITEALLFSYLINYRMELLKNEIIKHQKSLIFKNKKAQIGDMIGAITHQWKQPLTAISSIATALEYRLDAQKELPSKYLKPKLIQISEKIMFLIETIDDFKHFFNPKKMHEDIDVTTIIDRVISLSQDDMLSENIVVKTDLNFTKTINLYPNELLHIILNLMQNSKEAFEDKKIETKMIKIIGATQNDKIIIDIIDNAGGISEKVLPNIFDESFTTKKDKEGSGLGLYLTRFILEEHMNGTIEVKNTDEGTMFRIIL